MKVLIIWDSLSGYFLDSLLEVSQRHSIFVLHKPFGKDTGFEVPENLPRDLHLTEVEKWSRVEVIQRWSEISPDLVLISGWRNWKVHLVRKEPKEIRILCFDNKFEFKLKQLINIAIFRIFGKMKYDGCFVPGDPQYDYAKLLGFADSEIEKGLYSVDTSKFANKRSEKGSEFIFVGRLSVEKGIQNLIDAYRIYSAQVTDPYALRICGIGALRHLAIDVPGVILSGFVPPTDLPETFANSSCLILPSLNENWGVVIHEALASSLPIIYSNKIGSARNFLHDGWNGFKFSHNSVDSLVVAMISFHNLEVGDYLKMSRRAGLIAEQFSNANFTESIEKLAEIHN